MSLVADYSSSSEEEWQTNGEAAVTNKSATNTKPTLPSADELLAGGRSGKVLHNPYREAEDAKLAPLEKHVKMVNTSEKMSKNDKRMCWNHQKGRCLFGSNCTFVHSSDIGSKRLSHSGVVQEDIPSNSVIKARSVLQNNREPGLAFSKIKGRKVTKRVHPGLGNSLKPGKKVIKHYNKVKSRGTTEKTTHPNCI